MWSKNVLWKFIKALSIDIYILFQPYNPFSKTRLYSHFVGWCLYTEMQYFQLLQIVSNALFNYWVHPKVTRSKILTMEVKSWFHVCQCILSSRQTCEQLHYHATSGYPGYQCSDGHCYNVSRPLAELWWHKMVQWH
jgi:hypothetical protein